MRPSRVVVTPLVTTASLMAAVIAGGASVEDGEHRKSRQERGE
jgi:hypothetical protein